jgi:glycosyltransferase involved in cell wall biosynthesis
VPNGINLGMFYPEPDQGLVHSKGGNRAVVFMSRGDHYRKGFDIAMEVLGLLSRETGARMELWVCGTPLEQGPFPCKVRNFGVVSDAQLRHILSSADIFFYPSRHEGFGLFPLEAMACGCVVITTEAVPYARSLDCILTSTIGDVDGLLSHLTTLIDDEGLLRMLQSRVAQAARRYDISTSRDGFVTALASVIKEQTGCA